MGRVEDAIQPIKEAIALEPNNSDFLHRLSHLQAQKGLLEDAMQRNDSAIKVNTKMARFCSPLIELLNRVITWRRNKK